MALHSVEKLGAELTKALHLGDHASSHKLGAEQHPSTELEAEAKPRAEHQPSTDLVSESKPLWKEKDVEGDVSEFMDSTFASRYTAQPIKKNQFPRQGAPAHVVYQLIKDLRTLDATPRLNLASFVTTWMEPEAEKLIMESLDVNYVNTEEYPSSTEIQDQCVEMLAELYHSPATRGNAVGTATIGSSEAIMLGALSMKKRWQLNRKRLGLPIDKPNLVMGAQVHVCWEKFCRYWDVEMRVVPAEEGRYSSTPELMEPYIDENTVGIAVVLGSTYTGEFEDVEAFDAMIGRLNEENGWDLVIHVDAASGGFVAPFIYPELKWDFRLENVASINLSGHKYGLVYPGIGWLLWRDEDALPEEMVFYCNYLGTVERSITLNFSKGAALILAQYYQFLRLGIPGYKKIFHNLTIIKRRLEVALRKMGHFEILSKEVGVPLVAFRLNKVTGKDGTSHKRLYDEYALADRLRMKGWVLPAYTMPPNAENVKLLRVTIREDFSIHMVDKLIEDIEEALGWLDTHFTLTKGEVEQIAGKLIGRTISRLDSSLLSDPSKRPLVPC